MTHLLKHQKPLLYTLGSEDVDLSGKALEAWQIV